MKRRIGLGGVLALGLTAILAAPAQAADAGTIYVPDDFVKTLTDTRATGHYEVDGTALRIWTDSNNSTDKVAEYVATDTPLAEVDDASLEYTTTLGTTPPGFQLMVDIDGDGAHDGILVGEPTYYGANWWLNNQADAEFKATAPHTGGGSGSQWFGTLEEWSGENEGAVVTAFGFSLGSGVYGDYDLTAINFAGTRYTFAEHTVLEGKEECKKGGWATSTKPEFRNQGQCVSYFAKVEKMK